MRDTCIPVRSYREQVGDHVRTLVEDYRLHCARMVIRDVCFLSQRRHKFGAQCRTS